MVRGLETLVRDLDLPARVISTLEHAGVRTLGQILPIRRDRVHVRGVGASAMGAIDRLLADSFLESERE
jgi:hypothetical protein